MNIPKLLRSFNFYILPCSPCSFPFFRSTLDNQGLSPAQIGFVVGTGGFITIVAQPLWGMISDRTKTIRKVLLFLLLCSAIVGYLLYISSSYSQLILFAMLLYFFLMPIDPLTESLNFRIAESSGISYGSIRTYGALGYGIMALLTGYVMYYFGAQGLGLLFAGSSLLGLWSAGTCRMPRLPGNRSPGQSQAFPLQQRNAVISAAGLCQLCTGKNERYFSGGIYY